jgi:glycosyltransferase involved in cell wall biosynthesis
VGGTPELVVDGETGLLVPPDDVDALARALKRALADPGLATRMGEAGRARVERDFSLAASTARVLSLYSEAA